MDKVNGRDLWENALQNLMPTNYYLKYIKNFWKKKNVKTGTFIKEWAKSMNRKCTEEETQMANSILKTCQTPQ